MESIQSRPSRREGFALLGVLAISMLLTMLIAGLMGGSRSSFDLLRHTQAKERIDRTFHSLVEYCRLRLEHDFRWGKDRFGDQSGEYGELVVRELERSGRSILSGETRDGSVHFEVQIANNLTGHATLLEEAEDASRRRDGVPLGFCRLRLKVDSGGLTEHLEVTVRNPGYIGASLLANGDLDLDVLELQLLSRDPLKNQARSFAQTRLTGMNDFLFGANLPTLPDGAHAENPVIWSGTDMLLRDTVGQHFQEREPFAAGRSLQEERLLEQSRPLFEIPDVELDDILEVANRDDSSKPKREVPPGVYEFQEFSVSGKQVRILTRRTPPSSSADLHTDSGPVERFWYISDHDLGDPSYPTTDQVRGLIGVSSGVPGTHNIGVKHAPLVPGQDGAYVDLLQRRLVFDDRFNHEVAGDFAVRSGGSSAEHIKPALFFANPKRIEAVDNFEMEEAAEESETDTRHTGSLRAQGRLSLSGDISGSAVLAARGDVTLAPTRFYDELGDSRVNFSAYSGGDLSIVPPRLKEDARLDHRLNRLEGLDHHGNKVSARQPVYNPNGTYSRHIDIMNVSQNELEFTGLLYARGSLHFNLADTHLEPDQRRSLKVEGAVVAQGGDLVIENADEFEVVYNPKFVDRLLPRLYGDHQNRIEVVGWRPYRP